jgi:hypothetical protein
MADDLQSIEAHIADDIQRTDLTSEIADCVQAAIKHYQMRRWYFNEQRASVFNTVAGQEFYTSVDFADIPNYLKRDTVMITTGGTSRFELKERTWEWIDNVAVNTLSQGQPTDYGYYNQQMRFYPIPDQAYPIRVSGILRLATLVNPADTNAWVNTADAEPLIRAHAKWDLANNVIFDDDLASRCEKMTNICLNRLNAETRRRLGTGRVTPSWI